VLEFRIEGPLEVVDEQGAILLGGPRQRATLAILLLSVNRVVSVERLADYLYAGAAPVTAVTQVQRQISELRKALGSASVIDTRSPGYVIRLSHQQLDLDRFERQTEEAGRALERGEAELAADLLRDARGLWRGAPLADLAYESFAQTAIERLEEIRLAALEQRIEAELALGRHGKLVGELEQLVFEHPLRERFRGQLMLALYRSGRQAEALEVYRKTRAALVDEFGIEPTPALHELERAILGQDPSLDLTRAAPARARPPAEPDRAVLVLPSDEDQLDRLLAIAEVLATLPGRELIIARLVEDEAELEHAASTANARRASLKVRARTAAFTSPEPARDVVRLAMTYDGELVLLRCYCRARRGPAPGRACRDPRALACRRRSAHRIGDRVWARGRRVRAVRRRRARLGGARAGSLAVRGRLRAPATEARLVGRGSQAELGTGDRGLRDPRRTGRRRVALRCQNAADSCTCRYEHHARGQHQPPSAELAAHKGLPL